MARRVIPGRHLFVTRRTNRREFLLRPDPKTTQAMEYVFASSCKHYSVEPSAFCVMSDHYHHNSFDQEGRIVDLNRDMNSLSARLINSAHGEFDSVWNRSAPGVAECLDQAAVIDKITYTMANPTEAGLVRDGRLWRGAWHAYSVTKPKLIKRPNWLFSKSVDPARWPEQVLLEMVRPRGFERCTDDELAQWIDEMYREKLEAAHRKMKEKQRTFLGAKKSIQVSRHSRAKSYEKKFQINPQVCCRDPEERIRWLRANREFLETYADALRRWRAGDRHVVFPYGTYRMRVLHNVAVAEAPT